MAASNKYISCALEVLEIYSAEMFYCIPSSDAIEIGTFETETSTNIPRLET